MEYYRGIISPILDRLDSETMHVAARDALHLAEKNRFTLKLLEQFSFGRKRFSDPRLNTEVNGVNLENPIMVGAGWDKYGMSGQAFYTLGASGVEYGTIPFYPQPGNPKPRQFYKKGVALNRLGFNSPGGFQVAANLTNYIDKNIGAIGISIGKNKNVTSEDAPKAHADVTEIFAAAYKHHLIDISYLALNISSPNTPGLRDLLEKSLLKENIKAVKEVLDNMGVDLPMFVKIPPHPDLSWEGIDDVIEVATNYNLGIIACNTTVDLELKGLYGWATEQGGLSGNDYTYQTAVDKVISHIYRNSKIPVIGVGLVAGARAFQVVTGIREVGPTIFGRINSGIIKFMEREGYKSIEEFIGIGCDIWTH